jgi:septal ring-binding cell division protein DamX
MRDLKDLKREEEGPGPRKPPYFLIGLLGVLVFLTLVFVFRKKEEGPEPPPPPPVSQLAPEQSAPAPISPEREEPVLPDPAVKPGEMRFDSKPEPFPAAPPPPKGAPTTPGNPIPKEDLTFFDTLKDKEKKNVALQPKKETQPVTQKTKRPPEKKTDPKKVSVPPPTSGSSGAYTIQVASFSDRKGAETLSQKLKKKGYDAYVAAGEVPEKGTRYRVRVGHYPSRSDAQRAAERIQEAEKLSFLITTDSGK